MYKHIPIHERNIRVLRLLPNPIKTAQLECELIEAALDDLPRYEAISYTWDGQLPSWEINCHGEKLMITENADTVLRRFRRDSEEWLLWIDFICIYSHRTTMKDPRTLRFAP
ncbi:uncharacterized protein BDZ99DRAFT_461382 [Mytilinidion resinicola]|uniref:Heterokaryon incompatibility domain-containing protein n=1 Tax=Mytilinidion resinicola TaxID=574789 RepID=A0A6A6YUY1_9PEZI|nr:uncharacterized protein BDZ99DRAFT_461382 [Mytilinidion resinicola]KAF2812742.1 hypothetical protein BDZ99DRAFT_461382 [Mytilinidion resinicola]